jgi:hypothetical protein
MTFLKTNPYSLSIVIIHLELKIPKPSFISKAKENENLSEIERFIKNKKDS